MRRFAFPYLIISMIFATMIASTVIVPVMKDVIKDRLTGSNFDVAWFFSLAQLAGFLFAPVAGFFSDRQANRRMFIGVFAFLNAACYIALAHAPSVGLLLAARFIEGAVSVFVIGLLMSSISDRENDAENRMFHKKGILMGAAGMMLALGASFGMPLGGITGQVNPNTNFYISAGLMALTGLTAFSLLRDVPVHESDRIDFTVLTNSLKLNPYLLIPFIFTFIDRFTVGFLISVFNIHMRETLGFSVSQTGQLLGLTLLPMGLLSFPSVLIARKTGILPLALGGSLIYGGGLIVAGHLTDYSGIFTALLTGGLGAGLMFVPSMLLASRLAPKSADGTVMSTYIGCGALGFMLGPVCAAFLQSWIPDMAQLALVFGGLEIVMVFMTLPFLGRIRKFLDQSAEAN